MNLSDIWSKLTNKDDKELIHGINETFESAQRSYARSMQEQVWFRNILYYMGEQYLEYVKSMKTFRRRSLPDYIPTPVSNEIKEYVRSCKAMYLGQKYSVTVAPNTNEKEDIKSSELASTLLDNLNVANDGDYFDEVDKLTTSIPIFGTTFLRSFPKMDNDVWLFDKSGNLIPTGDISTENIIPFQVYLDILGDKLNKKRWIGIQSLRPKEWIEDTFKVKVSSSNKNTTDYLKRLMKMVSNVSPWKGANVETSSFDKDDESLELFRELEMKPSLKYPNGRYILSCGDTILKKYDRMPIPVRDGKWYYSLTDFHMDYIPGSFWSEPGVNGIISPQDSINEIDQALAINRKGVARPTMFTPGDVAIQKVDTVGGLGVGMLVLKYDPLLTGGQAPSIEQGTPLQQQILEERAIKKVSIQDISGDPKNILKGQSPGSKASGIMVDTLRETAERGKAPDLDRFRRSLVKEAKKRLIIAQEVITEDRLLKVCGKGNKWKITRFKGVDLRNNTDVRMELDSGLASTNSGKMSIIMDLAEKGFFGDITQNQELRDEVLRRVGMSGFTTQENCDAKRAENENAKMSVGDFSGIFLPPLPNKETGEISMDGEVVQNDPLFRFDDHMIHMDSHRKFFLSDEFSELEPDQQMLCMKHGDAHQFQIAEDAKNQKPEPKDPREFVQMDKLYALLTRKEQINYLPSIGIEPDTSTATVGTLTVQDVFKADNEAKLKQMDGENKANTEVIKAAVQPKEKQVNNKPI
jgi:hypothetical protein